jgi:hypothetical protein
MSKAMACVCVCVCVCIAEHDHAHDSIGLGSRVGSEQRTAQEMSSMTEVGVETQGERQGERLGTTIRVQGAGITITLLSKLRKSKIREWVSRSDCCSASMSVSAHSPRRGAGTLGQRSCAPCVCAHERVERGCELTGCSTCVHFMCTDDQVHR